MKGAKKKVVEESPIAFIKTDKSRILEVTESDGKFSVIGVYVSIDLNNIPLGGFHPKPATNIPSTYKKKKALEEEADDVDDDDSKSGGGEEKTGKDSLYTAFASVPPEKINRVIELINMGKRPIEICKETHVQMRTFIKLYGKLKELGRIDAKYLA